MIRQAVCRLSTIKSYDFAAAGLLFVLIFLFNVNTVLNNQFLYGATVFDSTFTQSIMWRSGWLLTPAPVIGEKSYFETHMSPILLIPNALSYLCPASSFASPFVFYAIFYALIYGALGVVAFYVLRKFYTGKWSLPLALISTIAFQLSGPVTAPQWEPH